METDPRGELVAHLVTDGRGDDGHAAVTQLGLWTLVYLRFRRHRLAVWSWRFLVFVLLVAVVGPVVAPPIPAPSATGVLPNLAHPPQLWPFDLRYLMGRDPTGVSITTYVLTGARTTLAIGVFGSLLAAVIGALVGSTSGYFGGVVDSLLMRVVDAFLTVPFLPLLMVLSIYLTDRSAPIYVALFGLTGWASVARLVRSGILSLREREYTDAARALGASDVGVIVRHLLPNTLDILIVACTLNVAVFILAEASLDFLGAGTSDLTWARGMQFGSNILTIEWWSYVFPGAAVLLTVLAVNFLGDGLRDALDTGSARVLPAGSAEGNIPGPLVRAGARVARWGAAGLVAYWATVAGPVRRVSAPLRRLQAFDRDAVSPPTVRRSRGYRLAQSGPIALILIVTAGIFLYGHSPLKYSPFYASPTTLAALVADSEYGAVAQPDGGWSLAFARADGSLVYQRTRADGTIRTASEITSGLYGTTALSLAMRGERGLIAWAGFDGTTVYAAYVGRTISGSFPLTTVAGQVAHPYVVGDPKGGYDVLYQLGTGRGPEYDIYLTRVLSGATRPSRVINISHARDYAMYPRAVFDGKGNLDVIYMNRVKLGQWSWMLARFDRNLRPLGTPRALGTVFYYAMLPGGGVNASIIPPRWGAAMARAADGSVWIAWDGNRVIWTAHIAPSGAVLSPARVAGTAGIEAEYDVTAVRALGLAPFARGGVLYHSYPGEQERYLAAYRFGPRGTGIGEPQRVSYEGGGDVTDPQAATVKGRPVVIWDKVRGMDAVLIASRWHPRQAPDLLTRFGLNVGNPVANVLFLTLGALTIGVGIAAINLLAILVLALAYVLLRRLFPRDIAWPAYAAVLAVALLWLFGRGGGAPPVVFVISGLAPPYGLLAAAVGAAVAWWAGRMLYGRQDALFRAISMAATALYVVAVLYAVVFVEGQIGRI